MVYGSKLLFKRLHPDATMPTRAYAGDAGWDLAIVEDKRIFSGQTVDLRTGVAVAIPFGWYGRVVHRSSTPRKRGLSVLEGTIDAGYRGEQLLRVTNITAQAIDVRKGDRLGQLIVCPCFTGEALETDDLPEADRSLAGYGSSGR